MKSISVSVHEEDYEVFRAHAKREGRSIAELVREAMRQYRQQLGNLNRLEHIAVLDGPVLKGPLPEKSDIYDDRVERPAASSSRFPCYKNFSTSSPMGEDSTNRPPLLHTRNRKDFEVFDFLLTEDLTL